MHVTIALPWWWHTIRKDNDELTRNMAQRFKQTLLLKFHYSFEIELERIVLLGGKVCVDSVGIEKAFVADMGFPSQLKSFFSILGNCCTVEMCGGAHYREWPCRPRSARKEHRPHGEAPRGNHSLFHHREPRPASSTFDLPA
mmetsp:Transcript_10015/g.18256  ORF Transcript_10015/g.18256 Transcript_10015/m.18256 type:complete len:142 (-) Transcript_10015:468-893(-)